MSESGERYWFQSEPVRGLSGLPSVTCPRCGMTSHHPRDVTEGYCGRCHDWTAIQSQEVAMSEWRTMRMQGVIEG